jgi:hypothetical protein
MSKPAPGETAGSASWTMWVYEDGVFVLKKYGIKISADVPQLTPAVHVKLLYLKTENGVLNRLWSKYDIYSFHYFSWRL